MLKTPVVELESMYAGLTTEYMATCISNFTDTEREIIKGRDAAIVSGNC